MSIASSVFVAGVLDPQLAGDQQVGAGNADATRCHPACRPAGTALVLEEFGKGIAQHGSAVVIASQSGQRLGALTAAKDEWTGPRGERYRRMLALSPVGRAGTPDEVANVAALLMGADGAFITGRDVLMDGGVTASYFYGKLAPEQQA